MAEHIGKLDNMRRNLEDLGEKQSDRMYQVVLIASLPAGYKSILEIWKLTYPDPRTDENLVSRIFKREEYLKTDDVACVAKRVTSCSQQGKNLFCWNCETKRHPVREYPKPPDKAKISKNRQGFNGRRLKLSRETAAKATQSVALTRKHRAP